MPDSETLTNILLAIKAGETPDVPGPFRIGRPTENPGIWAIVWRDGTPDRRVFASTSLERVVADFLVGVCFELWARAWHLRWEPAIRAGVKLMFETVSPTLLAWLGLSAEDLVKERQRVKWAKGGKNKPFEQYLKDADEPLLRPTNSNAIKHQQIGRAYRPGTDTTNPEIVAGEGITQDRIFKPKP